MAMVELAAERGAEKGSTCTPSSTAVIRRRAVRKKRWRHSKPNLPRSGKASHRSLIGRYYAMDRDNRWDRVEQAYDLLTLAKGEFQADTAVAGLQAAYARDENDEFVKATVIRAPARSMPRWKTATTLIFMNFRADRAREITRAFSSTPTSTALRVEKVVNLDFVMLTEYAADIKVACAYPPASLANTFGEWMAKHDKTQLRISETEKYAHVTFFFNGGVEEPFKGEERS